MNDDRLITPAELELKVATRHRIFLVLWIVMLSSLGVLFAVTLIARVPAAPNSTLTYGLMAAALTSIVVSVLIKFQMVRRAVEKRDLKALMSGQILAFAICELGALFGLADRFVTGSTYFQFTFAAAFTGMLLHFPRKEHVRAVS